MREDLIRYAIVHQGQYAAILRAVSEHEPVQPVPLQKAITILDEDYPEELRQLKKPPLVLFYQGNLQRLRERRIAIVGSRQLNEYGKQCTIAITEALKKEFCIVSGLAKGADALAHRHAEHTIAILGNGLDICYPYENRFLQQKIGQQDLLLSEYPYGCRPLKEHFPFRNRLIAALAESVIVTQARLHSGTMHTVNEALALGKEVYTVPQRFDSVDGQGCNALIEQGCGIITRENLKYLFDK